MPLDFIINEIYTLKLGREEATNLEPLTESILNNWNLKIFDEKLLQINFFEEQNQKMDYIY